MNNAGAEVAFNDASNPILVTLYNITAASAGNRGVVYYVSENDQVLKWDGITISSQTQNSVTFQTTHAGYFAINQTAADAST